MRIAVDARPLATPYNGIGRYTAALLERMIEFGHDWFLYSSGPTQSTLAGAPNVNTRSGIFDRASPLSLLYTQVVYRHWLKIDSPDVFWSPRHHLPLGLSPAIPQVVTVHDLVWKRFPETMPRGAKLLEQLLMPAAIKQAKEIICVSHFTANELADVWPAYAHKCKVIYSGASIATSGHRQPENPIDGPYILFVGTPEPRKNLARLIEAYALLKAGGDVREKLVIVGNCGWGTNDLEQIIKALSLSEEVVLSGRVSDARLQDLYHGARCLVLPSLYEGFGLPLVEGMQHSLPMVVSESSALVEIAGDACLSCNPLSPESIADALRTILTDDKLHGELSGNSQRRASTFDWQVAAEQTMKILEVASASN